MRELFGDTADHFGHEILALEIAVDHVHLFVQTDPKHSPADIARQSSRTQERTCWNGIPRFGSRISGAADSGRLGITWGVERHGDDRSSVEGSG